MYTSVALTVDARDALRQTVLDFTSPVGRRLTLSEVLIAALKVATLHRGELIDTLTQPHPE